MNHLTPDDIDCFNQEGYLIFEGLLDHDLNERLDGIATGDCSLHLLRIASKLGQRTRRARCASSCSCASQSRAP